MQQLDHDPREQGSRQQINLYPYISGTPDEMEESYHFRTVSPDGPHPAYQEGYVGSHETFAPQQQSPLRQQVYYMPVYPASFRTQETGTDGKLLAAFSYLGFWFTGLLILLFVRNNRFVRFHALQSLLFYSGAMLLYIIAPLAFSRFWHFTPFIPLIAVVGFLVVTAVAGLAWFVGLIGALSGKCWKFPLAGDLAELWTMPEEAKATVK